jgi:hypothetical protein
MSTPKGEEAADHEARPSVRSRIIPALAVGAPILLLVAVAGVLWYLSSAPVLDATLPELLTENLRRVREVSTVVVTESPAQQSSAPPPASVTPSFYYKSPCSYCRKSGIYTDLQNSEYGAELNSKEGAVEWIWSRHTAPFGMTDKALAESAAKALLEATDAAELKAYAEATDSKTRGPYPGTIDGRACTRFDLEYTEVVPPLPYPRPGATPREPNRYTEKMWFVNDDHWLLRREVSVIRGGRATPILPLHQVDYEYNVPLSDSLFSLPNPKAYGKPCHFRVVVRDDAGQPLPNARVYVGQLGWLEKVTTDAAGQAEAPWVWGWRAKRWWYGDGGRTQRLQADLHDEVFAESADGSLAGMYSFWGLTLAYDHGLIGEQESSDPNPDTAVTCDRETNLVTLSLTLRRKATVTGRLLDASGVPLSSMQAAVLVVYVVPRERPIGPPIYYGNLECEAGFFMQGQQADPSLTVATDEEGRFELTLPCNHPALLGFYRPGDPAAVERLRKLLGKPVKEEDLIRLGPGAPMSLGDVKIY